MCAVLVVASVDSEWVTSHMWTSHVTNMNKSCHVHRWSACCCRCRLWMSHVTHMNESCHMWMSHVTYMHEPCHIHSWAMSHTCMSHVTYMHEPCHIHAWAMSHTCMSHVIYMHEPCPTYEWIMSHIWMSEGTLMNKSWHVHRRWVLDFEDRWSSQHYSRPMYVTWLMYTCDMTDSYVWLDSFIDGTWLIRV